MGAPRIAYILPTYGHLDYAARCLESLRRSLGTSAFTLIVDDASPAWDADWAKGTDTEIIRFSSNGGLTRSWNAGFRRAIELGDCEYLITGNSDLLFAANWWDSIESALTTDDSEWDFVGPLSNAPGVSSCGLQNINAYYNGYRPHAQSDEQKAIDEVGYFMQHSTEGQQIKQCDINGFCMAARLKTWLAYAHNAADGHFFPPVIKTMPSGRKNPTPLMTGQEDWLNHRVRRAGRKCGVVTGSYVFHYRSISRGDKYAKYTPSFRRKETQA